MLWSIEAGKFTLQSPIYSYVSSHHSKTDWCYSNCYSQIRTNLKIEDNKDWEGEFPVALGKYRKCSRPFTLVIQKKGEGKITGQIECRSDLQRRKRDNRLKSVNPEEIITLKVVSQEGITN